MTRLVNCTPHDIHITSPTVGGALLTIPRSGHVARVETSHQGLGLIAIECGASISLVRHSHGEVTGLPGPADDTLYIVSIMVQEACPERDDLVVPAETIRDADGKIIGCKALAKTSGSTASTKLHLGDPARDLGPSLMGGTDDDAL